MGERRAGSGRDGGGEACLYGIHAVGELLRAAPGDLLRLWVCDRAGARGEIAAMAQATGRPVEVVPRSEIERRAPALHHQGVVAQVVAYRYAGLGELTAARPSLVLALDGVEDPRNLGAILRTASAAGAGGVILCARRSAGVTPAAISAAAGNVFRLRIARVTNLVRALETLKGEGYWALGLGPRASATIYEVDLARPLVLVVGGEGRGVRRLVAERCDSLARVPMGGGVESLNAAVAAGVALYELACCPRTAPGLDRARMPG